MQAPASGGSKAAVTTVVVIVGVLALLVIIGIVASIAIPVFLSQRAKAEDASAKADVAALGKEIATWYVDHPGNPPAVETAGDVYLVDGMIVARISPNVVLGGQTGSGATDWCVWVRNPEGDIKDFRYSAAEGLDSGTC
jgi:type II secretory pathway pseudopilin PulG